MGVVSTQSTWGNWGYLNWRLKNYKS